MHEKKKIVHLLCVVFMSNRCTIGYEKDKNQTCKHARLDIAGLKIHFDLFAKLI